MILSHRWNNVEIACCSIYVKVTNFIVCFIILCITFVQVQVSFTDTVFLVDDKTKLFSLVDQLEY